MTALGGMRSATTKIGPDDGEDFDNSDDGEDSDGWNKGLLGGGIAAASLGGVLLLTGRKKFGTVLSVDARTGERSPDHSVLTARANASDEGGAMSDLALARRLHAGDEAAFDRVLYGLLPACVPLRSHQAGWQRGRCGRDHAACPDPWAESFRTYKGEAALLTWLCTLCRRGDRRLDGARGAAS